MGKIETIVSVYEGDNFNPRVLCIAGVKATARAFQQSNWLGFGLDEAHAGQISCVTSSNSNEPVV